MRFSVLHLPGHSPGSIGLLNETDGLLFSGDAIYEGKLVDDLPGCDQAAYRLTMMRLKEMEVRAAHGGHGKAMTQQRMRQIAASYLNAAA
ncbi:glyoxylase-like metal-dependent hydrolase (beta-lactamase superfamily II) [Rhizobium mongolense]|uniref:Glyoxylase-like metal-dependent hydrolase (Beta-lactamase superfamily II) n=2 Tax=Rhizobium mongolense TaxID=57676 RepID=A0A7W6RVW3_9HYPH|nr:MBL fold metallo-hydrolase [Rhizobium mongolense]MBB4279614.1 glyoxylase-like metal-dependent hydrolase (beta-lactamase superfamily II) [Rhizobium mongolense]